MVRSIEDIKNRYHLPKPKLKHQVVIDEHKIYERRYRALEIFRMQNGKCFYCGQQMLLHKKHQHNEAFMTIDHYMPKSRGGTREGDNAIGACLKCNNNKSKLD